MPGMQIYKAWCNMQPSYLEVPGEDVSKVINDPTATFLGAAFGKYGCIPPHAFTTIDKPGGQDCEGLSGLSVHGISCAQAKYCITGLCSCGGNYVGGSGPSGSGPHGGCTAGTYPARFDVTVSEDGNTMTGSFVLPDRVETVHFTR